MGGTLSCRTAGVQRDKVTPIDPQRLTLAAAEYWRLRRRYWQFFLGAAVSFVIFGLPLIAYGDRMHQVYVVVLGMLTAVLGVIGWTGALVTWAVLFNWPCPSCGKRFILSRTSSWPTDYCKHCGLDLGSRDSA